MLGRTSEMSSARHETGSHALHNSVLFDKFVLSRQLYVPERRGAEGQTAKERLALKNKLRETLHRVEGTSSLGSGFRLGHQNC